MVPLAAETAMGAQFQHDHIVHFYHLHALDWVDIVSALKADRIVEFLYITKETQDFIKNVYIPDLLAVASFYKDWGAIGGTRSFLAWGEFPETHDEPASLYMPRGVIMKRNLAGVKMAQQEDVSEHVARS